MLTLYCPKNMSTYPRKKDLSIYIYIYYIQAIGTMLCVFCQNIKLTKMLQYIANLGGEM